jgi:hypothetical protein
MFSIIADFRFQIEDSDICNLQSEIFNFCVFSASPGGVAEADV